MQASGGWPPTSPAQEEQLRTALVVGRGPEGQLIPTASPVVAQNRRIGLIPEEIAAAWRLGGMQGALDALGCKEEVAHMWLPDTIREGHSKW